MFGIKYRKSEPARPPGRALGLRNVNLEPRSGLRGGRRGVNGIENAVSEPERPSGMDNRLRKGNLDPGKAI